MLALNFKKEKQAYKGDIKPKKMMPINQNR
jgi:hypothetical protein